MNFITKCFANERKLNKNTDPWYKLFLFATALILSLITLFNGENILLNDNGDFLRVTYLSSLYKVPEGGYKIALTSSPIFKQVFEILFNTTDIANYPSCQLILSRFSVVINLMINALTGAPIDNYSVYVIGVMQSIIYAFALTFTLTKFKLKNKFADICLKAVALVVMCDIGYVSYFNSFYGEGLQHILLIFYVGFIIKAFGKKQSYWDIALCTLVICLFATTKSFNIPCAILFFAIYVLVLLLNKESTKKKIVSACLGVVIISISVGAMSVIPSWMSEPTTYNSVFYGMLRHTTDEDAKDYVKDLGLDERYYELKDTTYYVSDMDSISKEYDITKITDLSKIDLATFYLKNPVRMFEVMPTIAKHSGIIRNIFFMDNSYMSDSFRFTLWSKVREHSGFDTLFINLLILILFITLVLCLMFKTKGKNRYTVAIGILMFVCVVYAFLVPYISNGEGDLAKHMYMYIEFADIMLISVFAMVGTLFDGKKGVIKSCLILLVFVISFMTLNIKSTPKTVTFGNFNGEDIVWYVVDETDEYKTLVTKDIIDELVYCESETNDYETSDIRNWLNNEFFKSFTDDEKDRLYAKEHKVLYSSAYKDKAMAGDRDFYCSPYDKFVARDYERAYGAYIKDYVYLPDVNIVNKMADKNYKTTLRENYWLETCYYTGGTKARYVGTDGFVYIENVKEKMGIRAVIYLKK